jgi:hypothetical protein
MSEGSRSVDRRRASAEVAGHLLTRRALTMKRRPWVQLAFAALIGYVAGRFQPRISWFRFAAAATRRAPSTCARLVHGIRGATPRRFWAEMGRHRAGGRSREGALASMVGRVVAGITALTQQVAGRSSAIVRRSGAASAVGRVSQQALGRRWSAFPLHADRPSLAAATLALSRGRAGTATYVASAVFVVAALYWWRGGKGNVWGPKPTLGHRYTRSPERDHRLSLLDRSGGAVVDHRARCVIAVEREGDRPDAGGACPW